MSDHSEALPPPNSPAEFESLCLDLWRELWGDPDAQRLGRSGQKQKGVDIAGRHQGRQVGVQCRSKNALNAESLTEAVLRKEVEKAKEFRPPLQAFILATTARRDVALQEVVRELAKKESFEITVWAWDDIQEALLTHLELLDRIFAVYWPARPRLAQLPPQKITTSRLPRTSGNLFGREQELADLEAAWKDKATHILSIVAWGGVGKTSLVAQWMADLAARNFDGADYFDWSFYSQGTRDQTTASADAFVDAALRFFGDVETADSQQSPWDKGSRLAQLVGERKTLLVLDGLEPLQHPPGPMAGELKDPAIQALLRGLALRNAGLCVVTTREPLADLSSYRNSVLREWHLDRLSTTAGVALLKALKVDGSAAELAAAVDEVGGHALTLNILGRFLVRAHGGDVRKRDRVRLEKADGKVLESHGHAFRAMATYERWLAAGGEEDHLRQLTILRLLGLFDRPAPAKCLAALRAEPVIVGLTEMLLGLGEEKWNTLVSDLAEAYLVVPDGENLDAHPLIREYFASRLRESGAGWQEAHGRLFDFLKDNTPYQPDTLAGLQQLYQAVYHGCQAGRQQEACDKVYRARIQRGSETFSTKKLGAFSADLGAVVCFFDLPWSRVSPSLAEADQAWLLHQAAFGLRALGRLREAVEPMRAGLVGYVQKENWKAAAITASNLSELELTLGEVQAAVVDAEQSVTFADRSGDAFQRVARRATEADVRHQAGEEGAALEVFREAEALQAERQPQYPLLYSLQGFRYCDFLLAPVERAAGSGRAGDSEGIAACAEVERRAVQTLEWEKGMPGAPILDFALHNLAIGRARLYRAILEGRASEAAAEAQGAIETAVAGLRAAGDQDMLVLGLLTRAWLRFACGDAEGARADLDEAWEIAERGSMRLFLADVALYRARFFGDGDALAETRRLVTECGYGRRLAEIEDLESRYTDEPGKSPRRLEAPGKSAANQEPLDPKLSEFAMSPANRATLAFYLVLARHAEPSLLRHLDLSEIQNAAARVSQAVQPGEQLVDALRKLEQQQIKPSPIWLAWLGQRKEPAP